MRDLYTPIHPSLSGIQAILFPKHVPIYITHVPWSLKSIQTIPRFISLNLMIIFPCFLKPWERPSKTIKNGRQSDLLEIQLGHKFQLLPRMGIDLIISIFIITVK